MFQYKKYRDYYLSDLQRYGNKRNGGIALQFQKILRKSSFCDNRWLLFYYRWRLRYYRNKYGLEILPSCKIGKGLYLGHPYNITINPRVVIGNNCNIHKGVVIGMENRGLRKGTPVIGDNVWIGINAAIVGNIEIGDDVLIAPLSFVNKNIPSHSVVFGNPCIIKHCDNATKDYVNNIYSSKKKNKSIAV